jgi:hypothetical protein
MRSCKTVLNSYSFLTKNDKIESQRVLKNKILTKLNFEYFVIPGFLCRKNYPIG